MEQPDRANFQNEKDYQDAVRFATVPSEIAETNLLAFLMLKYPWLVTIPPFSIKIKILLNMRRFTQEEQDKIRTIIGS